jgi:hypothetical protein
LLQTRPSAAQLRSQQRAWPLWSNRQRPALEHWDELPQLLPIGRRALQSPVEVLQPFPQLALLSHSTHASPSLPQKARVPLQFWAQQIAAPFPVVAS